MDDTEEMVATLKRPHPPGLSSNTSAQLAEKLSAKSSNLIYHIEKQSAKIRDALTPG